MCDKASFARLRNQTEENSRQIAALARTDAVQSEQLKTLFNTTKEQGDNQKMLLNRLIMAIIGILILVVLALIFGAIGERGFSAVTKAAPTMISPASAGH